MPTYDYRCTDCNHQMEAFQKITDSPLKECPACGKKTLQRAPGGGIGLVFKGSGFYANDYASDKKQPPAASSEPKSPGCCPCGKDKKCKEP